MLGRVRGKHNFCLHLLIGFDAGKGDAGGRLAAKGGEGQLPLGRVIQRPTPASACEPVSYACS